MHDNVKIKTLNTNIINKIYSRTDLEHFKTEYGIKEIYKIKRFNITLTFHRSFNSNTGEYFGLRELWINYNPHKIFNNNKHNGNDFPILDVIATNKKFFDFLSISNSELKDFSVISFEYGCNIPLKLMSNQFIDNVIFYKNSEFQIHKAITSKIVGCKDYKQIKIYDKSQNLKDFEIYAKDVKNNTIRLEIRCKKEYIQDKLKVYNVYDLLKQKTFEILIQTLLTDLQYILITEHDIKKESYTKSDYKFLNERKTKNYWIRLLKTTKTEKKFRNKFRNEVKRYNNISELKKYFDSVVKQKLSSYELCDFLAKEKDKNLPQLESVKINQTRLSDKITSCENLALRTCDKVQFFTNYRCKVTGLIKIYNNEDVLNKLELEYYSRHQTNQFELLKSLFLDSTKHFLKIEDQINVIHREIIKNKIEKFKTIDLENILLENINVTIQQIKHFNN